LTEIYVDCDACPVREEIYRVAARLQLNVFVVSNGSWPIRPPGTSNVRMVLVGDRADEERGSFLLIRAAAGFAAVEGRNGRIHPVTPDERAGVATTAEAVSALLAEKGCLPESEARRLFNELGDRGSGSPGRSDERNQTMAYVLIVDSQPQFRHQLVRLLESAGHQTAAVATITEAAGILQTQVPDLLATDVVLTDGSSTNLTEQAAALGNLCISQLQ
jgi:hypothetical protein